MIPSDAELREHWRLVNAAHKAWSESMADIVRATPGGASTAKRYAATVVMLGRVQDMNKAVEAMIDNFGPTHIYEIIEHEEDPA